MQYVDHIEAGHESWKLRSSDFAGARERGKFDALGTVEGDDFGCFLDGFE